MELIRYAEWGTPGLTPPGFHAPNMKLPVDVAYVHHSAGASPTDAGGEVHLLRQYDRQHRQKGWDGLGYSFVVAPSGRVYEGRGQRVGAHTENRNSTSFGICFLGTFLASVPTPEAMLASVTLMKHLIWTKGLTHGFLLRGHRDAKATQCPGDALYAQLKNLRALVSKEITVPEAPAPIYKVNAPPVGVALTPSGKRYIILCADGGVFTFGDAVYLGRVETNGSW